MDQKITSGDVTFEFKTGIFGGNPTITVTCRNLPVVGRTPQQCADWMAPWIDVAAKQFD